MPAYALIGGRLFEVSARRCGKTAAMTRQQAIDKLVAAVDRSRSQ